MRAIVIDDSRAIRLILGKILKKLGFEVYQAGDGLEGLENLKLIGHVDLALVDWNMPRMNGLEFIKAVRADSGYSDLRLMMVTTETQMENMCKALEAGADEYVMKPFTEDIILQKLEILGLGG